jgi:hypothetical protein
LLFGTDTLRSDQEKPPIIEFMRRGLADKRISKTAYAKIARGNAARLLKLKS